jgi:diguanylate cyclase (GGDEF)-like protein/PAS domain S-box-containing protein
MSNYVITIGNTSQVLVLPLPFFFPGTEQIMRRSSHPNPSAVEASLAVPAAGDDLTVRFLADLASRIVSSLDLHETLQEVVQAVVDHLGFGAAVINLVVPGDMCEVVAAAGPQEVAATLLGTRASTETWRAMLAACESWGELRFLDHRSDQRTARSLNGWIPPADPLDTPDAWHPDDILLAPLHAASGALIGVLSVDLPEGGRRPGRSHCQLLEQFAAYAALAIGNSRAHTLVADSEQLFRAMFDRSPIAIALLSGDRTVVRVNAAYEKLVGRPAADLVGQRAGELGQPGPGRRNGDAGAGRSDQYEVHFTRPDGTEVWGRASCTPLEGGTGEGHDLLLAQIEDITLLRLAQARFAHDATHDKLTGLANRALVMEHLAVALAVPDQGAGRVAVLFCDVDRFKEVNDSLGHAAGDRLLAGIARALQLTVRKQDTVGRLGGDEFVVIARKIKDREEAARLADRVIREASHAVDLDGYPVSPSLSIGVALSIAGDDADTLLAAADQALYRAKAGGRGRWEVASQR